MLDEGTQLNDINCSFINQLTYARYYSRHLNCINSFSVMTAYEVGIVIMSIT